MPQSDSVLRFFFDYVSPYSYLAWTQLPALAARFGLTLAPVPVLFGALLDAHGTRGPAEVPARRRYLIKDVARLAQRMGVPFNLPPAHPFNPLLALRVSSLPMAAPQRHALIDALFTATWVSGRGVTDVAEVTSLAMRAGLPAEAIAQAQTSEAKARVRQKTEEAIALGVFGVPTMLIRDELFWGCDSLPHLERFLVSPDPVDPDLVERWERLPAGAARRAAKESP